MNLAVIFDMDGVLIDSQPLHYEVDMDVLKACGYGAELSDVTPYTGISNPDRWPEYKKALNLEPTAERLIEMQEELIRKAYTRKETTAIDGIPQLLKELQSMKIPLGVASSTSPELIKLALTHIGIWDCFNVIISGEDVSVGKPAPDVYLRASEKIGVPPGRCIAVEDSPSGMLSAKNAGMTCIAYKNPNTFGQVFTHADHVVSRFSECIPIVRGLL